MIGIIGSLTARPANSIASLNLVTVKSYSHNIIQQIWAKKIGIIGCLLALNK